MKYLALVGEDCPTAAVNALRRHEDIYNVCVLPPDSLIDSPIATHPDTIMFIHAAKLYCHRSYAEKNAELIQYICHSCGMSITTDNSKRGGKYPFDCGYNALSVPAADIIIGNKNALADTVKCRPVTHTNQGYAACCAAAIGKTVITADTSIKSAAETAGLEVFPVTGGDMALRGYNTGFIGGCTGVTDKTVFTVGDPYSCTTGRELTRFCKDRGYELVPLCSGILTDVGGIKLIKFTN